MNFKLITPVKKLTDGELMLKIRKGQEKAFEEFVADMLAVCKVFFIECLEAIKNWRPILPRKYLNESGNFVINTPLVSK